MRGGWGLAGPLEGCGQEVLILVEGDGGADGDGQVAGYLQAQTGGLVVQVSVTVEPGVHSNDVNAGGRVGDVECSAVAGDLDGTAFVAEFGGILQEVAKYDGKKVLVRVPGKVCGQIDPCVEVSLIDQALEELNLFL